MKQISRSLRTIVKHAIRQHGYLDAEQIVRSLAIHEDFKTVTLDEATAALDWLCEIGAAVKTGECYRSAGLICPDLLEIQQ